jgi:hypothetical protein
MGIAWVRVDTRLRQKENAAGMASVERFKNQLSGVSQNTKS